jgi:hypothetical protein
VDCAAAICTGRGQHELVPVRILKDRRSSPVGLLRLLHELYALALQHLRGRLHVVGDESDVEEAANLFLCSSGVNSTSLVSERAGMAGEAKADRGATSEHHGDSGLHGASAVAALIQPAD